MQGIDVLDQYFPWKRAWLGGATVARLTPVQKVACSNHVRVTCFIYKCPFPNFDFMKPYRQKIQFLMFLQARNVEMADKIRCKKITPIRV